MCEYQIAYLASYLTGCSLTCTCAAAAAACRDRNGNLSPEEVMQALVQAGEAACGGLSGFLTVVTILRCNSIFSWLASMLPAIWVKGP